VILLDLNMPRMGGIETLKKIRATEHTKLLPVVVLTSSDEEQDMTESYECGVNSYIRKPVDFSQFVDSVRQLSLYWMVLNQHPHTS
jgi:two-component system response regulator